MDCTVSELIVALLKKAGVRFVAGVPAGQLLGVMDALGRDPEITYVTTRHEEAAGHMADAISRVSGTLGVCFGTTGPGATNLLPGVAAAWADNIPLVALTGNNQSFRNAQELSALLRSPMARMIQPPSESRKSD